MESSLFSLKTEPIAIRQLVRSPQEATADYARGLWDAFPDLTFEIISKAQTGPESVAAQWVMRGTNTGSLQGLPPTGRSVEVPGADFIEIEETRYAPCKAILTHGLCLTSLASKLWCSRRPSVHFPSE